MTQIKICNSTVMDQVSDPEIFFDEDGNSNYFHEIKDLRKKINFTNIRGKKNLINLKKKIKSKKNKEYDCIVGVSGGADSSYVAFLAWKLKLRVLLVHFDNGWNSPNAIKNINNIINITDFPLETFVMDWDEFKDMQRSFLKASVVDVELLTDHCLFSIAMKIAKRRKIKIILSGSNIATENFMPNSWIWHKRDVKNIKDIHKKYGSKKISKYPYMSELQYFWYTNNPLYKIEYIRILDLFAYQKKIVIKELKYYLDWSNHGGKHFESFFTKFYQSYYLPVKYNIDKRKVHLSSLIVNGDITRDEALKELSKLPYDISEISKDIKYVCKKLDLSILEFNEIMIEKRKEHFDYNNKLKFRNYLKKFKLLVFINRQIKKFVKI